MYSLNNLKIILIINFIIGLLLIGFSFVFMILSFNNTGNEKYNFLKYLPFELNPFRRCLKKTYIYVALIILGSLFLISSLIVYFLIFNDKIIFLTFLIMIFVSIFSFNILMFIKLSNTKIHLVFALINSFSILLSSLFEFMFLGSSNILIYSGSSFNIFITIINLIFCLVLIFNPSYKKWIKMVHVDSQTMYRVKFNYLAMLEWGSFIVTILNFIPLIISLF